MTLEKYWSNQCRYSKEENLSQTCEVLREELSSSSRRPDWDDIFLQRKSLKMLKLNDRNISDLRPLAAFTELINLELDANAIQDLGPLQGLQNLEILSLENNQITDLTPLSDLVKLEEINLANNLVVDLDPLERLQNIDRLVLENNKIESIEALAGLIWLDVLRIQNNLIKDLSPLENLPHLEIVRIAGNQIRDFGPLYDVRYVFGKELQVNPVSFTDLLKTRLPTASEMEEDVCPICLENYHSQDSISQIDIPSCQHIFHRTCLELWLHHGNCPKCRASFF